MFVNQKKDDGTLLIGEHQNSIILLTFLHFKGTVSRDFRPLVFFTNQPHLGT
jgi:hypothetical protein